METSDHGPHVLAGVLVLALYWRTLLARKGSGPHRRSGPHLPRDAGAAAGERRADRRCTSGAGDPARMAQIVYLALVLGTAGWTAWRAVRDRAAPERFRGPVFRALAVAMAGVAAA